MNLPWHQRLIVRIGAGVLLVEIIALSLMGWWYTRAFAERVDHERQRRLAMPGTLMARAFLNFEAVTEGPLWRDLLGEEVVEAFIFNSLGHVNSSLRPERLNQNAFEIAGLRESELRGLPTDGRFTNLTEQGESFTVCVYPLKVGAGEAAVFHLYLKVRTTGAEALKAQVARRFVLGSTATIAVTTLVLIALFARQVGRGLHNIIDAAGQVGQGELGARVAVDGSTSELNVLGRQVNGMLETLTRRERELRELSRFQQVILDQAAYAIIATDAQGIVTAFNRTAERMLGYQAEELIGRQTPGVFHDVTEVRERAARLSSELGKPVEPGFDTFVCRTRHGLPNEQEWTYVRKDGSRFPVMLGITALKDERDQATGYLGIAVDLSLRREAEIELRRSRSQLEAAQRLARLGSWEVELATNTVRWSREMYELYGREVHLGPPPRPEFHQLIHPEDLPLVQDIHLHATRHREPVSCDFRTHPGRGAVKHLSAQVFCLRDSADRPVSIGGTVQDITDRKAAEMALREAEERSRLILESLREGVTVHGPQGVILSANCSAERILGMSTEEMTALSRSTLDWSAIRPDGSLFPAKEYPIHRSFATGQPVTGVVMGLKRGSGERFWISINSSPLIRAGEAAPYNVVASFFDVSDQQAAVKASLERARLAELDAAISRSLAGSKPLPETLAECVRLVVSFLDAAMCRVWLMTEDEQDLLRLVATDGFDTRLEGPFTAIPVGRFKVGKVAARRRALLANELGGSSGLEISEWERAAGVTAFAGFPLIADGRLLGVFGIFSRREISGETFATLSRLADRLSLGVLRKLGEEQIQHLNAELERRVAERTAELGRRVKEVETLNRSMINLLEDLQQARDVAESSARQIESVNRRLRMANEELESFSYSVSHDLRAPLRNVSGFVDLLRKKLDAQLDEPGARYMKIIQDESQRMARLIDDLLEFSRLGRARLRLETYPMRELVGQVIEEAGGAGGPAEWQIGELQDCASDRALIRQVWFNLISNALKYSRNSRPPLISVGMQPSETSPRERVYFVRDNGVGFDMSYLDKLFGVFQRLHSNAEFEGTGIGLANVQRIVSRHGGRVWAAGAVGQGATFYFALPLGAA